MIVFIAPQKLSHCSFCKPRVPTPNAIVLCIELIVLSSGCSCKHLRDSEVELGARRERNRHPGGKMGMKHLWLLVLLICAAALSRSCNAALAPAVFVLGDSTVDTGNQNYITSVIKSNYAPYGKDFVPPGPTGRFSNGKLANDFIADYLGLPSPVNFLSPSATGGTLLTGVNVASSGSGYLDITGQLFGVVNLTRQIENIAIVQADIVGQIGQQATADMFSKAIFIISTGSNDFVNNYNLNPVVQNKYNPQQWQQLVLDSINKNLQTLYNMGVRKVTIDSLGPVGCAPEQLNLYGSKDGNCIDWINEPLKSFNVGLKSLVGQLRSQYSDFDLLYANVYDVLWNFVSDPKAYGYQYSNTACCGEGSWKGLPCVNPLSDVCSNADDYVFWDLFHPSQKTYQNLANGIISGDSNVIYPTNLNGIL